MSGPPSQPAPARRPHYLERWDPVLGRWAKLHRSIAAQTLGRPLAPGEVVHHIDGDPRNNDPHNLAVLPSQSQHAALEGRLRRVRSGQPPLFWEVLDPEICRAAVRLGSHTTAAPAASVR